MLKGSICALVTPMKEDYTVDFNKLETLVETQIQEGTDALLALGTTSEAPTLTFAEQKEVLAFIIEKVNHRVPVIANSGSNNTQEAVDKSKLFAQMGADYLLVITPYYNKTSPNGLIAHFTTIAEAAPIPIILYHIPGRTGLTIPFEVMKQLSQHPNIVGVKEASGSIQYLMQVATLVNDNFSLLSGDDDLIYPVLALGGSGVISTLANLYPHFVHQLTADYFEGHAEKSREKQLQAMAVIHHLFTETNPIPVKKAFQFLGKDMGPLRLPLVEMSPEKAADLKRALEDFKGGL